MLFNMKRMVIAVLILSMVVLASTGCASSRRYNSELRGLMLQDNIKLGRNRAYFSKHNVKTKKEAYRKYHKNTRLFVFGRK
jgi:hypothetical protein